MAAADRPSGGRLARKTRALGGIAAQSSQALTSFVLQVIAARMLGIEGLGVFAALYALLILATGICSGFVGDSLTVLDRAAAPVRAALQAWLAAIAATAGVLAWLGSWLTGFVEPAAALAFGGATAAFLVEDIVRRMLMAGMQFWRIVLVDVAGLIGAVGVLLALRGSTLTDLMLGLMGGQLVALVVAVLLLPSSERWLAPLRPAAMREVARYGTSRGVQQAVRPALLAAVRLVSVAVVGLAATGQLEAARIYMAPSMLVVGGVSSFLFASYALDKAAPLAVSVRRADRSVLLLIAAVGAFGVVAVLLMPILAPILTGGEYELSVVSVAGWGAFAASVAAVTPYGSLAAVRGRQLSVLLLRISDSVLSLALVVTVLLLSRSAEWVPFVLAGASLLGGLAIRQGILRREVRRQAVSGPADGAGSAPQPAGAAAR